MKGEMIYSVFVLEVKLFKIRKGGKEK